MTYQWNFGDGGTVTGTLIPAYIYNTPGDYTATFTATDPSYGFSSSSSVQISVADVPPAVSIGGPYQGSAQSPVGFSASATDVNTVEQSELLYSWNFGDGTTATGPGPGHAFAQDGLYDVNLTVTDSYGGSTQATAVVEIFPSVNLAPVKAATAGAMVSFQGTASGAARSIISGTSAMARRPPARSIRPMSTRRPDLMWPS